MAMLALGTSPLAQRLEVSMIAFLSGIFQFHKGPISIALSAAAQFSSLEELKK